jgi:poly-gamma-glutamate capsule biosynthesis protein CapA/YwtB (metallophosphatase superfamily)
MATGEKGVTLFVCGDVMLGRGIDQILPHPSDPTLYEHYTDSAVDYVRLAERRYGEIPRRCSFDYVWGEALTDLDIAQPLARIINLETSITTSTCPEPKEINYKMNPDNVACLKVAAMDCCVLANNHVLDWGVAGLLETLSTLEREGIAAAGAGADAAQAAVPAIIDLPNDRRILVFGFGVTTSGIPRDWAAAPTKPGVNLLQYLSLATANETARRIVALRRPGDLVVVSIHWSTNWGYKVDTEQRTFAHALIDAGACDLLHGHSSHHPRGIEIYRDRPILYGCGDFITDYEGIEGYEQFRGDLAIAYLPSFREDGALSELTLLPYQMRRFRLQRASRGDVAWLQAALDRESARFGTHVAAKDGRLVAAARKGSVKQGAASIPRLTRVKD